MAKNTIINIGRQFGSGGMQLAEALGAKLGIPVYDRSLIAEAAAQSGISRDFLEQKDEKVTRFSFVRSFLNDGTLFKVQSDAIRQIAQNGPAIFVGRASDYVLRDMDCLDVFVCSPLSVRIARVAERLALSNDSAEKLIAKTDRERAEFYNSVTFEEWGVASNYDICVDSSILGIEDTAEFIIDFGRKAGLII